MFACYIPTICSLFIHDKALFEWGGYLCNFSFMAQFPAWTLGIVLFYVIDSGILKTIKDKNALSVFFLLSSIVIFFNVLLGSEFFEIYIYSFAFFGIMISQEMKKYKLINNDFFSFLGCYSFEIYLTHYWGYVFANKMIELYCPVNIAYVRFVASFIIALMVSIIASVALHWILNPLIKHYELKLKENYANDVT